MSDDVIVIGGGSPDEHGAGALAEGGLGVALIGRELVGGECSYWACIPSKTLLRPGETVHGAREAAATATLEAKAPLAWRDFMVSSCSDAEQERWLADRGIDLLRDTIQPFPTFSEIYVDALNSLRARDCSRAAAGPGGIAMNPITARLRRRAAVRPAADTSLAPLRSTTGVSLIAATVLASGVGQYDAYVVNVAVPAIGRDLGASVAAIQWTLTSYLLSVAALLLVAGALADRFGRRRVLVIGLCVIFVSSILCASAPSIDRLIAARVVQGVGAALVVPTSLALLNGTLRVSDRAGGIGVWAGLTTLATTIGPYVGGWLVDHVSWRWVFLLDLPLILLALAALRRVPETSGARRSLSLDIVGALLAILGLGALIYAVTEGAGAGWSSARILVAFLVGGLALVALVPTERRRRAPMLRLSLFRSRQFDAINATTVLFYGAVSAAGYLLVLQCQLQLGYSAAQAGAALIPASAVFLAVSPLSGALVARVGPRWLIVAGILVVATALLWLSQAQPGDGYAAAILPPALLWGLGLGLTVPPLTAAVLAAVGDTDLGEASAINNTAARLGAVIVIAVVPLLIGATGSRSLARALAGGYEPAMIAVGAVSVAAAVVAGLFVADDRAAAPRLAPPAPYHGCALPVTRPEAAV